VSEAAAPAAARPAAAPHVPSGLTLAEAFHLLARALGELPAPVTHETLRARMAALHGKEDPLLESSRFARLLRQANDAEIADVRMVAEGEYEISPHKADLALKMRPVGATPDQPAAASVARPVAALRFRGGSRTATRPSELQMVGVVRLDAPETAPASSASPAVVEAPSAPAPGPAGETPGAVAENAGRPKTRRGKRGGRKHKTVDAGAAASDAAPAGSSIKSAKAAKPSTRRTSKPLAS
jgi:hypothetical protein